VPLLVLETYGGHMIYIVVILIVAIAVYIFLRIGGIKHQVRFYTKKYFQELNAGYTNEEAIHNLVGFYLQGEPEWKAVYMKEQINEYIKNFDGLVYDIALFYYKIDPEQQTWQVDRFSKPVPPEYIIQQADKYLRIYKQKYFGTPDLGS